MKAIPDKAEKIHARRLNKECAVYFMTENITRNPPENSRKKIEKNE